MKSIRYLLMLSLVLFFSKESKGQIQCPNLTGYISGTSYFEPNPFDVWATVDYSI